MKARSRAKSVEVVLSQLSSGYGAQRLPSALRAIEIQDVPSRGLWKGQRAFLKDILPKIKYHNTHLEITTEWKRGPERKKRSSKETSQAENSSEAASPSAERASPLIRLRFDDMPPQELLMGDKSSRQIARDLAALIQKAVGGPEILAEEGTDGITTSDKIAAVEEGEEERILSEAFASTASDAPTDATALSATNIDPTSALKAPAVPSASS